MTDSHEGLTPDREVVGRGDGSANGEIVLGKETDIVAVNGHGNSDEDKDDEEKKEQQDQEQEQKEEQEEEKGTDTAQARQGRRVIVLCGLVGSGKSSFARALQTHFPRYVRCNQDELGSRQKVQLAAEAALRSRVDSVRDGSEPGTSTQAAEPRAFADKVAVIDRTNIDEGHRKPWVDMADQFGVNAEAMMFDTPYEICRERLLLRKDHETLKDPQRALDVLSRFQRDMRPPTHAEGFRRILHVHPEDMPSGPDVSRDDVVALLDRLARADTVDAPRSSIVGSGSAPRRILAPSGPRKGSPYARSYGSRRPPPLLQQQQHQQQQQHLAYGPGPTPGPYGFPRPAFGFPPPHPGFPPAHYNPHYHGAPPPPVQYANAGPWRGPAGRGAPFHHPHRGPRPPPSAPHGPSAGASFPVGAPRGPARTHLHAQANGDYRNTGPTRGARTLN